MAFKKSIVWFEEVDKNDVGLVGGKGANLGEMTRAKFPIPYGFIITSAAYFDFIKKNNLEKEIKKALQGLNTNRQDDLQLASKTVKKLIVSATLPAPLAKQIVSYYDNLPLKEKKYFSSHLGFFNHVGGKIRSLYNPVAVAVRSSATAEDLPDASFAGQQETYLNIRGEAQLLLTCRRVFASLFTNRAISYRVDKGFAHMDVALSIGVQKMVRSDKGAAGVIFTLDTESGFRDVVFITGAYCLGENVGQGAVDPDGFYFFKPTLEKGSEPILKRRLGHKAIKMVYGEDALAGTSTTNVDVSLAAQNTFCLDDDEVLTLARYATIIEKHYSKKAGKDRPMDIEWAKDGITGELFIVQARPETVQSQRNALIRDVYKLNEKGTAITRGRAVGEKISTGKARVILSADQINEVKPGDILVTD